MSMCVCQTIIGDGTITTGRAATTTIIETGTTVGTTAGTIIAHKVATGTITTVTTIAGTEIGIGIAL